MSNLQKQSSRWVVPLTLRPADDENTRFLPDCGYETVECQLDSGSTCEVMTLRQCCQILQNGDPKLDESHCRLRFYDGSTITPVGVCHFICQKNDCEAKLSFQIIDTEEERQIPPLLSAISMQTISADYTEFFRDNRLIVGPHGYKFDASLLRGYSSEVRECVQQIGPTPREVSHVYRFRCNSSATCASESTSPIAGTGQS